MLNRRPARIPDIYTDPRIPLSAYEPTFVKSLVMVPIRAEEPIGAIGNYWAELHEASDEEVKLLQALAHSTSVALENVTLLEGLERHVQARTAELHVANHELAARNAALRELQEQKEALSALLVHDIRSPAATIVMAAELQLDRPALGERDRRAWTHVLAASEAITRMATNLLDIAKGESGGLVLHEQRLDLGLLVRDAASAMATMAEGRSQHIELDLPGTPLEMRADPECLRRVLQNVIDNALRYSPGGSRLRVSACAVDATSVELSVADEGPGIPAELRERVFEKYARLVGSEAREMGRGLGLSFCRLAVEAHGGRIWAEQHEPKGTRFRIRLPRGQV